VPTNFYVFKGIMKIKLIRNFGTQIIKGLWLREVAHVCVQCLACLSESLKLLLPEN
jgi:hypothetical protein